MSVAFIERNPVAQCGATTYPGSGYASGACSPTKEVAMGQKPKRALCLAGGGPAAGLHIGALDAFAEAGFEFDVWSLSCIGAWVGVVYNSFDGGCRLDKGRVEKTFEFFRDRIFRNDDSYARFPINSVF